MHSEQVPWLLCCIVSLPLQQASFPGKYAQCRPAALYSCSASILCKSSIKNTQIVHCMLLATFETYEHINSVVFWEFPILPIVEKVLPEKQLTIYHGLIMNSRIIIAMV